MNCILDHWYLHIILVLKRCGGLDSGIGLVDKAVAD